MMVAKAKKAQQKTVKLKVKTGDEVVVIAGKDKGKRGQIKNVLPDASRVLVEGVNLLTKHVRPNPQKGIKGGLEKQEGTLHISNVAIFNAQTQKADRVGYKVLNDGTKVRIYRSTGEQIDTK